MSLRGFATASGTSTGHVLLTMVKDALVLLVIVTGCMSVIACAVVVFTVAMRVFHGRRRAGRERQSAQPEQAEQPIWDRARLTADEYTALAEIEAEEKAAEQERRSGDGGR